MINRIEKFFIPSVLLGVNDGEQVRSLLVLSVLGVVLAPVYAILWVIIVSPHSEGLVFPLLGLISTSLPLLLIRLNLVQVARNIFLGGTWVLVTGTMLTTGATHAPIFELYMLIVMMAALLSGWPLALKYAVVTIVVGFVIAILDPSGLILSPITSPLIAWLTHTAVMIIVIAAAYFIHRQTQQALQLSRKALTDLKNAQQTLRESEEHFRLTASVTSDYTFFNKVNAQGELEYSHSLFSGAFEDISGYTPEEFQAIGGWRATLHPDDVPQDDQNMALLHANKLVVAELRIIKKGGEVRWVRVSALPKWDEEANRLIGITGGIRDITEGKQAEDALRRSEAHFRALLDATTDVAFLMSRDGTLLTLNEAMARPLGKSIAEMIGQNGFDFLEPVVRKVRYSQFERVAESEEPVRWEDASQKGFWDNSVYPIRSSAGSVDAFAVYSRDITEQVHLEAELQKYTNRLEKLVNERTDALHRANEQLEFVLNNTKDALAFADSEGNILVSNPAFRATFSQTGTPSIEFILWALVNEEQIGSVGETLLKVIYDNESGQVQAQVLAEEGQEKDVELTLIPVRTVAGDSKSGVLLHGHDITHMKEIERFKARFVADALHDLATPISGINTRLYLLQRSPEKLTDHVRALENQVRHLRNLLEDLRTLSQMDRGQIALHLEMSNVNELVQLVFDTYEPIALEKQQTLLVRVDPALPDVRLDARQIERVLVNLVSNAVNYTPQYKEISIETILDEQACVIRVTDQGIGISAEDIPRIFERFYRTRLASAYRPAPDWGWLSPKKLSKCMAVQSQCSAYKGKAANLLSDCQFE